MSLSLPITDRKIRFALVGCGRISKNHIEALAKHGERAEWVAVCDTRPDALQAAVAASGAPGFASLDALLAVAAPDIVVLATPSGLHPQQAIAVARTGRHVLSGMPMATKLDEGIAMGRACRDAGDKLYVVKQNRLNSTVQWVKQAIAEGRFGRIFLSTVNVF
ncbi:MAG: Gfo/Idh/MocA family oxidoreductase, partial [Rhizobacter sp.]|nr:Gfo/Idh/MocA family oxidoreductase [Rhizobacter sp.]